MKGWILTVPEQIHELPISPKAAQAMGMEIVNVYDIEVLIDLNFDGKILVGNQYQEIPDYVIVAFTSQKSYKPMAVIRQFESLGIVCLNSSSSISLSKDKVYTYQVLAASSLPIAKTLYCNKENVDINNIEQKFTYPLILKIIDGTQGNGVYLINSREDLQQKLTSTDLSSDILIQEYIATSKGKDIRVTLFCGKVIKIVSRVSNNSNEFRSNIHLGGSAVSYPINNRIIELGEKVYKASGIALCGLDLLCNGNDYIICELNSVPGGLTEEFGYNPMKDILNGIAAMVMKKPVPQWKIKRSLALAQNTPLYKVIAGLGNPDSFKMLMEITNQCEQVQALTLKSILDNANNSIIAKDYNFNSINNIESYRKQIPITSWKDYQHYISKMQQGENNVLFNGKTDSFITTSGTTNIPKFIPESALGKFAKGFVTSIKFSAIISIMPQLARKGKVFPIVVPSSPNNSYKGIPCGFASGMAIKQLPKELENRIAFPLDVANIQDNTLFDYITMRYAIENKDVAVIAGNNAIRLVRLIEQAAKNKEIIIKDIAEGTISFKGTNDNDTAIVNKITKTLKPNIERSIELKQILESNEPFNPITYWKELKLVTFWTSASVGLSVRELKPLLPKETVFVDTGYGASELKVNIPIQPNKTDGLLSCSTAFYEFLPINDNGNKTLLAHELCIGKEYDLIVTTYAGMYRYKLNDVVKCTGYNNNTPMIEFVRKSGDVCNINGEKLYATALIDAMNIACKQCNLNYKRFQAMPIYEEAYYQIFIESNISNNKLEEILDECIKEKHFSYNNFRKSNLLNPVKVTFMKDGWQEYLYKKQMKERNISEAQIKLPIFINEKPSLDWYAE